MEQHLLISRSFANHLDRICAPSYSPNSDDVFHARARTTGIHRYIFNVPEHGPCNVYDVGGERAERKKWINIFDQTATVVIFVPMDSYDQVLYEDENVVSHQLVHASFCFDRCPEPYARGPHALRVSCQL